MGNFFQTLWRKQKGPLADRGEIGIPVHQLYPSEADDKTDFNFDIILFHSLQSAGGEKLWESTWVSPRAGVDGGPVCWPTVWLPEDLNGIRVLSVSYDADAAKYFGMENTDDEIEDIGENLAKTMDGHGIGQRRFVLIGHGFGGLIIKSLMSEMKRLSHIAIRNDLDLDLKSKAVSFLEHLKGIVFYAVPHRDIDAYFDHLGSHERPLKRLRSSPKKMEKLSITTFDAFNGRSINIYAFIEGKRTNGKWIVPKGAAMPLSGNQHVIVGDCDHSEVCKPPNKKHMSYFKLLTLLKQCGAGMSEDPPYPSVPSNLLGMEENMTKLEQLLGTYSRVGVVGMGGIGKTTLVKEFYRRKSVGFEAKSILLDVKSKDSLHWQRCLLQDIVKDGRYNDSKPPRDIEEGKTLLQRFLPEKRVLIVLDDVGKHSVEDLILDGLKLQTGSKLILTSRNWSMLENHVAEKLEVEFLQNSEAMKLFCLHAFKEQSCPDKNLGGITNDIVSACSGLPLSLEVVGSFLLKKREISFWKGVLKKLKNARSLDGGEDDKLWKTLKISFDDLGKPERGKFLDVACFFCSDIRLSVTREMALIIWDSGDEGFVELQNLIDRHPAS